MGELNTLTHKINFINEKNVFAEKMKNRKWVSTMKSKIVHYLNNNTLYS